MKNKNYKMSSKPIARIGIVLMIILLLAGNADATAIWDEESGSSLPFTWNHTNFDGFNVSGIGTENLTIVQTNLGVAPGKTRTIRNWEDLSGAGLIYNTTGYLVEYEVSKNEGLPVEYALNSAGYKVYSGNYYAKANLFGEQYIALNGKANKLTKLVLEQKRTEQKILAVGGTWNLGDGYALTAQSIDAKALPRQVWLTLSKDGVKLDDKVAAQGQVYTYIEKSFAGETDVPLFATFVDGVFAGTKQEFVVLKYAWLVSRTAVEIRSGDRFGLLRVVSSSWNEIKFDNDYTISLAPNATINLARNIKFKVIDNATYLKFYPTVEPKLNITASSQSVPVGTPVNVTFTVTSNNSPVSGATISLSGAATGSALAGVDGRANMIINATYNGTIIVEAGKSGYTNGTATIQAYALPAVALSSWVLQENYTLNIVDIDIKTAPRQARLQLSKNGAVIKDSIVPQGSVFEYCPSYNCMFNASVNNIFNGTQGNLIKLVNVNQYSSNGTPLLSNAVYLYKSANFTGIGWQLDEGYELKMMDFDARAAPRLVWFELLKNNSAVDDAIVSYGQRYYYNCSNLTILTARVDAVFKGEMSSIVKVKEVYQYSETNGVPLLSNAAYSFISGTVSKTDQPLYENYTISVLGIDSIAVPRLAWLRLYRNSVLADEILAMEGDVYNYNSSGVPILYAEVSAIFAGHPVRAVQFRNVTQLSEANGSVLISNATYTVVVNGTPFPVPVPTITPTPIYNTYEVHGSAASIEGKFNLSAPPVTWNPQSLAGFYYDLEYNLGEEELSIKSIDVPGRSIPVNSIYYNTSAQPKMLNVVKEVFGGNARAAYDKGLKAFEEGSYHIVGWQGEKYVALNGKVNKLAKLILEQGKTTAEKKTLVTGDTWGIGGGWTLTVQSIDVKAYPRQAWLVLGKDGIKMDDIFISQGSIYTYVERSISNESNVPLFVTYVDSIFAGATSDMVQLRYTWALSTEVIIIQMGDRFGVLEVKSTAPDLVLTNTYSKSLPRDTIDYIMGNLKFSVADSDSLGFMPVATVRPLTSTYEIRGSVWNQTPINGFGGSGSIAVWNTSNFAGFFFDLNNNLGKEELHILQTDLNAYQRTININNLAYSTGAQSKRLNVVKYAFDDNVSAAQQSGLERTGSGEAFENGSYYIIGWQGEKYAALNGKVNKLVKVVLEQGKATAEKKTLTVNETWNIGGGWTLTAQAIDAKASPRQAWLVLYKDGVKKDNKIISDKKIYTYVENSIAGEANIPLFVTYIDSIFAGATSDMIQLRYTWAVSIDAAIINSGDNIGVFKVVDLDIAGKRVGLKNRDASVSLTRGTTVNLMGNLKFRVLDDADILRFMPVVERYAVLQPPIPPSPAPVTCPPPTESRYVWDANLTPNLTYTWTPMNFDGFYYDVDNNIGSESLCVKLDNYSNRTIDTGNLIYSTVPQEISFKYSGFGSYGVIGFMGEKYFAGYTANSTPPNPTTTVGAKSVLGQGQLHKILMDDDTMRTIIVGSTLTLNEGYVLKLKDIDINATTVLLSLEKDGTEVDTGAVSAGQTYVYSKRVGAISDLPIIAVHIDSVFRGREVNASFIKGIFQISESYASVNTGNRYGLMEITGVSDSGISMRNANQIYLSQGNTIDIWGYLKFKIADSDILRFYPETIGLNERRGAIYTSSNNITAWDALNFAGFWYDLDSGFYSESMVIKNLMGRLIPEGSLNYTSNGVQVHYVVTKMTGKIPNGTNGTYTAVGWIGEKHIAIKGKNNKLAKVLLEQGATTAEKKTLAVNETWELGDGWTLKAQVIDAKASPRRVWLNLSKDGVNKDDHVLFQGDVYTYSTSFAGENDVPLFVTYVDSIFAGATSDMVQLSYTWLVSSNVTEVRTGDRFGIFNVTKVGADSIDLENYNSISLNAGGKTTLIDALNFNVADSSELRFYPSKVFQSPAFSSEIISYYRRLGSNPNVVETTDLLKAADDWSRDTAPPGFSTSITTIQLLALADEWSRS